MRVGIAAVLAVLVLPVAAAAPGAPNGKTAGTIAFLRGNYDASSFQVYLVQADGTRLRALAAAAGGPPSPPSWSPNGRIAFSGDVPSVDYGTVPGLKSVRPGGKPVTLVPRGGEDTDAAYVIPLWSPDGRRIALDVVTGLDSRVQQSVIAVVRSDGAGLRELTQGPEDCCAAWSPASDAIAFWSSGGIEVVPVAGGKSVQVAHATVFGGPAWSSKGLVAFAGPTGVQVMRSDGSDRRIVAAVRNPSQPAWSPKGRTLAFGAGAVYVVRPDGSGLRRVTPKMGALDPAWSPDGKRIAFEAKRHIWVTNALGGGLKQLTHGSLEDESPVWQPR